jgi:hypothetical protein
MYNWDEKGFLIGLALKLKRIMSRSSYEEGKLKGARQDGSREFITLLAAICADLTPLPAALIYRGKSLDLMDTWLDDLNEEDIAYFATSEKGWSSDAYGLDWLNKVFDKHTRAKAGRGRRLLIVDGHSSHVNMAFLDQCDRLKILVLILPPHSTHRLQPLDCGNFLPLSTYYGQGIQGILTDSEGAVSMTKRMFFGVFKPAFEKAFSEENIRSAWAKTGIWPLNPGVVLDAIAPRPNSDITEELPQKPDREPGEVKTPYTAKSIRQFHLIYAKNPTKALQRKLFKANMTLAAEREIANHRADGLKRALTLEKTKRKRSKRLNLLGEEASGVPQFYGPEEIKKAREVQAEKAAQEAREKEEKAAKKVKDAEEREAKKAREAAEKRARAEKKEVDRQVAREAKAQAKIDAATARKEATAAKKAATTASKASKSPKKTRVVILKVGSTSPGSLGPDDQVDVEEVEDDGGVVPVTTKRGRRVNLPVRLRE